MKSRLLTLAGVLALLAVMGKFYAKPLLAQVRAALVRDVDNPALEPVVAKLSSAIPTFHVPPGKRFVIEYVSWRGTLNAGFIVGVGLAVTTNGTESIQWVPGSPVSGENIGGRKVFIVADPDHDVLYQSAGSIGTGVVAVSGHYVNVP